MIFIKKHNLYILSGMLMLLLKEKGFQKIFEYAIPPLAIPRKSMLHFGFGEGAEMIATYHSIISTVKMQGRSAWEYLGKFFTKSLIKRIESSLLELLSVKTLSNIFNGCRDFSVCDPTNFRANESRTKLV